MTAEFFLINYGLKQNESSPRMKKVLRRHNRCELAVVTWSQKPLLHRIPLPGGAGWPKFNQLEMVTTFTYRPILVKIDARNSSYCGNRPTNTQTDRGDYNTLCSLARSVKMHSYNRYPGSCSQ